MSDHSDNPTAIREELAALQHQLDAIQEDLETVTNRDTPLLKEIIKSLMNAGLETGAVLPAAGREFCQRVAEYGCRLDASRPVSRS